MQMAWWMWAVVAAFLFVLEISGPGFFIIFFAVGALCTAGALALWPELSLWAQLGVFSLVSVASLLALRQKLAQAFGQTGPASSDDLLRDIATALDDIAPGAIGKAELRGTPWTARNTGEQALSKGQRCKVTAVDGLTLLLLPE